MAAAAMNHPPDEDAGSRDVIESVGKALRIIEAFDDRNPRLTVSEAARRAGITRTAARRYLLSLAHFGYAHSDGRHFALAPRVLRLGYSYLEAARLPRLAEPHIQRLAATCGEAVNVSVLDGHEVVFIARGSPPRAPLSGHAVGTRLPAHVATAGVAMLSTLPDPELADWIEHHAFSPFTPHTVVDPALFAEHVRLARRLGHWVTERQLDPALCGVAVPLKDRQGACRAAIGMTLPAGLPDIARVTGQLLPLLHEVARSLWPLL